MYFPDHLFLPFIKSVDQTVKSIANANGIKQHGKPIIEVSTQKVKSDPQLRKVFTDALATKFDSLNGLSSAIDSVYVELLRKLCNACLGEFMDSTDKSKSNPTILTELKKHNLVILLQ